MKKLFKSILLCSALAFALAPLTGCSDDDKVDNGSFGNLITDITNPKEGKTVSHYGETVSVKFKAAKAWSAELAFVEGEDWAKISHKTGETGGASSVNVSISRNTTEAERSVKIMLTIDGRTDELCTLKQAAGINDNISEDLNKQMHEKLLKDYLWNKEYAELGDKIEMDVDWQDFLETNLLKEPLASVNLEDGGIYRDYSSLRGQRYIYSYIDETTGTRAESRVNYNNLGIGPTNSVNYDNAGTVALIVGYVYMDSPADKAGLRRGDMIIAVNGTKLNRSNYSKYQQELFYNPTGSYEITYSRYVQMDESSVIQQQKPITIKSDSYAYTPVIGGFALQYPAENPQHTIGYLATESFDLSAQKHIEQILEQFKQQQITDLILDLRHNVGGAVAQARYMASAIAGSAHKDDAFVKMERNDKSIETWNFGYGNPNDQDGFGQAPELNLKRLYIICSETTASASELIINGLRGIDFPVYLYGSRTAGKNVGMEVRQLTAKGRTFEFAPITFRGYNAKMEGDYADGFAVDYMVNNQNSNLDDDISPLFPYATGDWENFDQPAMWAYGHITGQDTSIFDDFNWGSSKAAAARSIDGTVMTPLKNIEYKFPNRLTGNRVY